jgi:hypothetical protein
MCSAFVAADFKKSLTSVEQIPNIQPAQVCLFGRVSNATLMKCDNVAKYSFVASREKGVELRCSLTQSIKS